jgi:hypothetical protein
MSALSLPLGSFGIFGERATRDDRDYFEERCGIRPIFVPERAMGRDARQRCDGQYWRNTLPERRERDASATKERSERVYGYPKSV